MLSGWRFGILRWSAVNRRSRLGHWVLLARNTQPYIKYSGGRTKIGTTALCRGWTTVRRRSASIARKNSSYELHSIAGQWLAGKLLIRWAIVWRSLLHGLTVGHVLASRMLRIVVSKTLLAQCGDCHDLSLNYQNCLQCQIHRRNLTGELRHALKVISFSAKLLACQTLYWIWSLVYHPKQILQNHLIPDRPLPPHSYSYTPSLLHFPASN